MSATMKLSEFVVDTRLADIPTPVQRTGSLWFADWLGVAIGGSMTDEGRIVGNLVAEQGGKPESTVFGCDSKSTATNAALANGVMGHSLELDDFHNDSVTHTAVAVMPAAFAIAEARQASGADMIAAIILGYEVAIRVGAALAPRHVRAGFHPTGTCGTLGAAAAAGKLLGLSALQLANALGIAGTQAAGMLEFGPARDAMTKRLNPGRAASNGVTAALLAGAGFTGSTEIFEGPNGFLKTYGGPETPSAEMLVQNIGESYGISGSSLKPYPCCRAFHSAIDAVLQLREEHGIDPSDVTEVLVETNPIAFDQSGPQAYQPATLLSSQLSLPYNVGRALIDGAVRPSHEFQPDRRILDFAPLVRVVLDKGIADEYPRNLGSRVTIRMAVRGDVTCLMLTAKGDPDKPLSRADVAAKFVAVTSPVLGDTGALKVWNAARAVLSLADVSNLVPASLSRRG